MRHRADISFWLSLIKLQGSLQPEIQPNSTFAILLEEKTSLVYPVLPYLIFGLVGPLRFCMDQS
jgi:hypothetical protein